MHSGNTTVRRGEEDSFETEEGIDLKGVSVCLALDRVGRSVLPYPFLTYTQYGPSRNQTIRNAKLFFLQNKDKGVSLIFKKRAS